MAAELKPYPAYKDSGVEWLGSVPDHWETLKLRQALRRHTERERPDLPLLSVVREHGVILRDTTSFDENHNYIPDDLSNYKVVRAGQFVMNKMKAWQGSYGVSRHDGIVSPAYFVFDVLGLRGDFFHAAIRSRAYVPAFTRASDGVRIGQWDLSEVRMREVPFLVPSASEQAAIVRFLDHADQRIRRYIHSKERLIALLEEQRQIVVHEAITGRIDVRTGRPYPAYKDSGVEWLGSVPEHWEVRRVKSLSLVKRGASPRPIADSKYFDDYGEYAWVRIADVTASGRYLERTTQRLSALGQSLSVPLEPGALFLSIAGSVGKPTIARIKCCIHDGFVYFPQFNGLVEFLYRVFACGAPFARLGKLGTQLNLNTDTVGNISVGWPSVEEQTIIVEYLNRATGDTDAAIDRARLQIERLREYRSCLIADVVTGKLDVREAAARLPEVDPLSAESDLVDGVDHDTGSAWTNCRPAEEAGAQVGAG